MGMSFEEDVVGAEFRVPGDSIVIGGDIVPEGESYEVGSVASWFIDVS